jgi:hypothetical protein
MSIFDKVYTLTNRVIDRSKTPPGQELPDSPCIFCGSMIKHLEDGGPGYIIHAMYRGKPEQFLHCVHPACRAVEQHSHEIWRCGCISDYIEMVGDECTACRRPRRDAMPYDWDVETDQVTVANLRALVLDEVYKLLPSETIQLLGSEQYVGLGGFLSSTGTFKANVWPRTEMLHVNHINEMPVETLVELRRMLRERFPDRKPSQRPELPESCHAAKRTKRR